MSKIFVLDKVSLKFQHYLLKSKIQNMTKVSFSNDKI